MQVGSGHASRTADRAHQVAPAHFLAGLDVELGEVRVIGLHAAAMIDDHEAAISAVGCGVYYDAVRCRADACGALMSTPLWNAPSPENGSVRWP